MNTQWRIYIHGMIDGFSHYILYCKARGANSAAAVGEIFENHRYQGYMPIRLRTDRGWENRRLWEIMLETYPSRIKAVLVGPSTRNVRIERLWRTLGPQKIVIWKARFLAMERAHGLDRHNAMHIWCLHFVFLPLINRELDSWVSAQNLKPHPGDPTPGQRFPPAVRFRQGLHLTHEAEADMLERARALNADQEYGVEHERFSRWMEPDFTIDDREHNQWPTCNFVLSDEETSEVERRFPARVIFRDRTEGVQSWIDVKNFVQNVVNVR